MTTPEQAARDLLERMGVPDAQSKSAVELVELANLIQDHRTMRAFVAKVADYGDERAPVRQAAEILLHVKAGE